MLRRQQTALVRFLSVLGLAIDLESSRRQQSPVCPLPTIVVTSALLYVPLTRHETRALRDP